MRPGDDDPALDDVPIGPKGAPGDPTTFSREWTALSPEEERIQLETYLEECRRRGDAGEVERVEARLRLLHAR
jgi:hypothetical protein